MTIVVGHSRRCFDATSRRIQNELRPAGPNQLSLDGNRRHRNDAVTAHRAPALVVHEQHTGVRATRDRLGEDCAVHVGMSARLEHQRSAQVVDVLLRPRPFGQHGVAFGTWQPFDDQAERLSRRVRVDGANAVDHFGCRWRSTVYGLRSTVA